MNRIGTDHPRRVVGAADVVLRAISVEVDVHQEGSERHDDR
jgi:hypothetical protein